MDRTQVADGFNDNDLRLLAHRAAAVKDALRSLNQPPPFNEPRLIAYLDLLEATPEPKDGEVVLQARSVIRATHAQILAPTRSRRPLPSTGNWPRSMAT